MQTDRDGLFKFVPSVFSTPERLRARFNTVYQGQNCTKLALESKPTQADVEKYVSTFPEEGDKLKRLHGLSRFTGLSTAAGLVGGSVWALRTTRNMPLVGVTVFLSTFTSIVVSDDIGSWIYGTYKFDNGRTNEKFLEWVSAEREEKAGVSS